MCPNRVESLQNIGDPPHEFCPDCGMPVKRVVSRPAFEISKTSNADKAAKKGFTIFRRAEKGVWERTAGEGPEFIVGTKADMAEIEAEKKPTKVLDLDKPG